LSFRNYTKSSKLISNESDFSFQSCHLISSFSLVDIWSVGCIFAEMLGRRVLFPGKNCKFIVIGVVRNWTDFLLIILDVSQLNLILDLLGTPSTENMNRIKSKRARHYIQNLPKKPGIPLKSIFPHANPLATDLLQKMLHFDP